MAISTLSTLSTSKYRGGAALYSAAGLATNLNTIIAKINEMIGAWGDVDTLYVGSSLGSYYGGSDSWMTIDGTYPPTVSALRVQDQLDGSYKTATISNGSWSIA